ncbi:MAG: septum formation initiator family protein [Candidatus Daviesbacteria bacterium]|nr:septum formation initiator family protein [Candidatus Daviesbacteria bacterium]
MIRKITSGLIILVILFIVYNLVNQIIEATRSGERLSEAADVVYKLEAKNKQLKSELAQIQSQEFIEEEIRDKLGFSRKGETVVVIPEEKLKAVLGASQAASVRLPNWLGWLKVFFK